MAITLLPQEYQKSGAKLLRLAKNISKTVYILLSLYILFLIVFAGFFAYVLIQKQKINNQRTSLVNAVGSLKDKEIALFIAKDRILTLSSVTSNRFTLEKAINIVTDLVKQDGGLKINELKSESNTIKFTLFAQDSFALEHLITNLRNTKGFSQVNLETINKSEGAYTVVLTVVL